MKQYAPPIILVLFMLLSAFLGRVAATELFPDKPTDCPQSFSSPECRYISLTCFVATDEGNAIWCQAIRDGDRLGTYHQPLRRNLVPSIWLTTREVREGDLERVTLKQLCEKETP